MTYGLDECKPSYKLTTGNAGKKKAEQRFSVAKLEAPTSREQVVGSSHTDFGPHQVT